MNILIIIYCHKYFFKYERKLVGTSVRISVCTYVDRSRFFSFSVNSVSVIFQLIFFGFNSVHYFFKIEIQTEMILAESETYSTVLVQCTVHNHRSMYIRTYTYPYTRIYEFPFILKKLLMTINNDKYVHTYVHSYICIYEISFLFSI